MLAVTTDLVLVLAAWSTVLAVWLARRSFNPSSVWDKLMVGSTLVAFALLVRFADLFWAKIPWPALSTPLIQQIAVVVGLLGGTLAIAAGVAEWIRIALPAELSRAFSTPSFTEVGSFILACHVRREYGSGIPDRID